MSDNIPFEIQIEIIKRAPVKSLIRFRSVSKSWKSLIDSSEFIAGYRARKTQPRSLLVRYKDNSDCYERYVSVNNDTFTQQQDLTPNVPALMKQIKFLLVIGYSRGLLCFHASFEKKGMLVLWNPSIRRSVSIIGSFEVRRPITFIGSPYLFDLFGFAVCPVSNEPTIVKLVYPWKAEIFTLSSKVWTVIQCSKPRDRECESVSIHEGMQVVIDSCIYRVAYERIRLHNCSFTDQYMIVSFDLNAKEFKAIDLPDAITNPFTSPVRFIISKLKGSLVVIVPHSEIKVWKMEPNCSFTQLFTINTSCITDIVGFRKNGELVVETQETPGRYVFFGGTGDSYGGPASALKVYDSCSKQITNLGMSGQNGSFFISSYKETLLLLDHSDSCEYPEIN
ncbi:F-box protein-like protein [Tanacetum coccineum]